MLPTEPAAIFSRIHRSVAGTRGSRPRAVLAVATVVVVVIVSVPVLLAAFVAPFLLVGTFASDVFGTRQLGGVPYSPWAVAAVTLAYVLVIVLLRAPIPLPWRRVRSAPEGEDEATGKGPPASGVRGPADDGPEPGGGLRPAGIRARVRAALRRVRERPASLLPVLGELALYLVVALLLMWPLSLALGEAFVGWQDAQYYGWLHWRIGELLAHGPYGLRIPDVIWPYGVDVRLLDGQLPSLIGGAWNMVATPYLAHNLGLLTGTLLSIWAGRRLGKLFSPHRAVWIISAVAFATAPAITSRLVVHFTLYYAFAGALLVEEGVRVARGDRPPSPLRLGLLLFLAYLCGIYALVFGALAFFLTVAMSKALRIAWRRTMLRVVAGIGVALLLIAPFLAPRVRMDREELAAGRDPVLLRWTFESGADVLSVVAQPPTSTLDIPGSDFLRKNFRLRNVPEATIFPGFLLLVAGFAGLAFLRTTLRMPLLVTALTLWLLSLGTSLKIDGNHLFTTAAGQPVAWLPYAGFFGVPGLASLRSPNRVSSTLAAVLAVGLAIGAAWLFQRFTRGWQRAVMAVAAGGVLLFNLVIPVQQTRLPVTPAVERAFEEVRARAGPGESLLLIPADCVSETSWDVDLQILHRTPVIGCQASPSAIPWQSGLALYARSSPLAELRCHPERLGRRSDLPFSRKDRFDPAELPELHRDLGVRFILVDLELLQKPVCARVRAAVASLLGGYELLGRDDRFIVIDTRQAVIP